MLAVDIYSSSIMGSTIKRSRAWKLMTLQGTPVMGNFHFDVIPYSIISLFIILSLLVFFDLGFYLLCDIS